MNKTINAHCRSCKNKNKYIFLDLKNAPVSNAYVLKKNINLKEKIFPLKTFVCKNCKLVQTVDYVKSKDIFNKDYIYLSSFINTLISESKELVEYMIKSFKIKKKDKVLEIAANDGYLLQFFQKKKIECLGIDPSKTAVDLAKKKNIPMIRDFFSFKLSKKIVNQKGRFKYLIAKNVLAHVPKLDDFIKGVSNILSKDGVACFEFQYLNDLIRLNAFDQIYHEHFSYINLCSAKNMFNRHDMEIFDCKKIPAQNGSLRIFVRHKNYKNLPISKSVKKLFKEEIKFDALDHKKIKIFRLRVNKIRNNFLKFMHNNRNKYIVGYGAAAKANTLLNFSGIKHPKIKYVVDLNNEKQGKFLPGSKIPIVGPSCLMKRDMKPDYIIIFPWNLVKEISQQLFYLKKKIKVKFIQIFPTLKKIN